MIPMTEKMSKPIPIRVTGVGDDIVDIRMPSKPMPPEYYEPENPRKAQRWGGVVGAILLIVLFLVLGLVVVVIP